MKNKLTDLNNHLFAELERLSDEELKGDELEQELKRADAISKISTQVISNGSLALKAAQFQNDYGVQASDIPLLEEVVNEQKIHR